MNDTEKEIGGKRVEVTGKPESGGQKLVLASESFPDRIHLLPMASNRFFRA